MKHSAKHFQLCKAFFDETKLPFEGREHFMWGTLLLPIDCDLALQLGILRKKLGFLHTAHFSEGRTIDKKEKEFIARGLEAFINSSACFRGIVVSAKEWEGLDTVVGQARLAGQLLSYPWMPYEGDLYRLFSRSRIVFDRLSLTPALEIQFLDAVNKMIKRPNKLSGATSYPIEGAAIAFCDKAIFDELQLVDLINGIIRLSYLLMSNERNLPPDKLDLHNEFLKKFPKLGSFVKASRNQTDQKMNVWHFEPKPPVKA